MGFGAWEEGLSGISLPPTGMSSAVDGIPLRIPSGRTFDSVEFRVRAALEEIMSAEAERIVAVSTGDNQGCARVLLGVSPAAVWRMKITNCSVTAFDMDKEYPGVLNDDIHTGLSEDGARDLFFSLDFLPSC